MSSSRLQSVAWVAALSAAVLLRPTDLSAADFIRGDANGDGIVSLADIAPMYRYLFWGEDDVPCLAALDADGERGISVGDGVFVFRYLVFDEAPPPAPFPERGPEPANGGDSLGCASYGGRSPTIVDGADTTLAVRNAVFAGGTAHGFITVELTSPRTFDAYFGRIIDVAGVIADGPDGWEESQDLVSEFTGAARMDSGAHFDGNVLRFGFLGLAEPNPGLPAGQDVPLLSIPVCLHAGTRAGDYPISLEAAELVTYDNEPVIVRPRLVDGVLRVQSDVSAMDCEPTRAIDVRFRLADGAAERGGTVSVPLSVEASQRFEGIRFSVAYDARVLEAVGVAPLWTRPDGEPFDIAIYDITPDFPAETGEVTGVVGGLFLVSNPRFDEPMLPIDESLPFIDLKFHVDPQASIGPTEIRFFDGAPASDREEHSTVCTRPRGPGTLSCFNFREYRNALHSGNRFVTPELANSFVFINGRLEIVADVGFFRGDSNGDGTLDLSDPVRTLDYLFMGEKSLPCLDAADANDDGGIDISDPIAVLGHLFLGSAPIPAPNAPECGLDPTADALGCREFTSCR